MIPTVSKKEAVIKAIKEVLRLVVLGIPALGIQIISGDTTLAAQYGVPVLFVLRAIDKYIHTDPSINANGLLPF